MTSKGVDRNITLVVGAGAAGLSAAYHLLKAGYNVIVLEANDYIGGRIKSLENDSSHPMEIGASLIHDKTQELYAIASRKGMLITRHGKMRFIVNGKFMGVIKLLFGLRLRDLFKIRKIFNSLYSYDGKDKPLSYLLTLVEVGEIFRKVFSGVYSASLGTSIENVGVRSLRHSLIGAGLRAEKDIVSIQVKGAFIQLLSEYVEAVSPCVRLGTVVDSIDYQSDLVSVTTASGEVIIANEVVVTVPLSILKGESIKFSPPLPENKQEAIRKLGMGQGAKIAIKFKHKVWKKDCSYIIDCDKNITYFIQSPQNDRYVLIAFIIGHESCSSNENMVNSILSDLDAHFHGMASLAFESAHVQNWSQEKYIAGTYSYDAVHSEGCREALAESVENKLYFAGEAAVNGHAATVDGALISGKRAAVEIIRKRN